MTSNQNYLEANKQRLYNKLSSIEKCSYYQFSSEYQLYAKLMEYSFAYCPRHY
jgi:hypothetical protein